MTAMTVSVVVMQRVIRPGTRLLGTQRDARLAETRSMHGMYTCMEEEVKLYVDPDIAITKGNLHLQVVVPSHANVFEDYSELVVRHFFAILVQFRVGNNLWEIRRVQDRKVGL